MVSYFGSSGAHAGQWFDVADRYLGIRLDLSSGTHFGWVRCDVPYGASMVTIKDFAFETAPNTPIAAATGNRVRLALRLWRPKTLGHSNGISHVNLNWDPVSGSVACQVQGTRLIPAGPTRAVVLTGCDVSTTSVPYALVGPGTTWEWKVRCACSIIRSLPLGSRLPTRFRRPVPTGRPS